MWLKGHETGINLGGDVDSYSRYIYIHGTIHENLIGKELYSKDIPDPDLLIRTGGEFRLSNFLLWQAAYSELLITDTHWPDFREEALLNGIYEYQNRQRRFGQTAEQITA